MPVLSVTELTISFSGPPVLENASLHVERGERVCIVGRNGAGKSTLLKAIAGEHGLEGGSIAFPEGGAAAALPQEIPADIDRSVGDIVASGFGPDGETLLAIHAGSADAHLDPELQWQMEARLDKTIKDLQLDPDARFPALSGGMKRRVLLGRAIVAEPSVLILDEPTNHMDLESILWLEDFLLASKLTLLFVTHDRAFLRRLATRIVEIDLAQLTSYSCDYDTYLKRKDALLEAEEKNRAAFEKKLSQEEAWLRRGVKARRTRNEGRVTALKRMREERRAMRTRQGAASFGLQQAESSGTKVLAVRQASAAIGGKQILAPFDLDVIRRDRIGIIGPNGSGKTTLLRLLLGRLAPASGEVIAGTKLSVSYFDQLREQLDDSKTVFENVADGAEAVRVGDKTRHVITYLQDFLFTPDQARSSLKTLSGGERNRLLLAKLFAQPANLLVMDEPTNDLDAETLELLEERILEYDGTLLLVSHDRAFLENTVTSLLVIEPGGRVREHPGGYEDWVARKAEAAKAAKSDAKSSRGNWKDRKPRMSNREREELAALPARIETMDARREQIAAELADAATYKDREARVRALQQELANLETASEAAFARWEELEAKGSATDTSDEAPGGRSGAGA